MTAAVFGVFILAGAVQGATFTIHPSVAVSEEFTDNVFSTENGRVSDFITRALPGISAQLKTPALDAKVQYLLDYRHYARGNKGDEITHNAAAEAHLTTNRDLLRVDVQERYRRVSLDVTRDVTRESLFVNQEDQNLIAVSPYFTLHPVAGTEVRSGYQLVDTHYPDSSLGVDKTDHNAFVEGRYTLSPNWTATAGYTFTREENELDDFDGHQPYAGFRAEFGTKSFVFGRVGYTWTRFDSGRRLSKLYWSAGASHAIGTVTVAIDTGVRYDESPVNTILPESYVIGSVTKSLNNGTVGCSLFFSEFTDAETDSLNTRKYGGTLQGRYDFAPRLRGELEFTGENYDQPPRGGSTRRFLVDSRLGYFISDNLTVSLNYVYVNYWSRDIAVDNYEVNRGIVEVRKIF